MNSEPHIQPEQPHSLGGRIAAVVNLARTALKAIVRDDQYEVAQQPHPDADQHRDE